MSDEGGGRGGEKGLRDVEMGGREGFGRSGMEI